MTRSTVIVAAVMVLAALSVCSCTVVFPGPRHAHHPPAHAPAHGVRARTYVYYPSSYVYFDSAGGRYFYMVGGTWTVSASLPVGITIVASEGVSLELDTDRPYTHFHTHKAKYPPGQLKKVPGKGPGKGHGKGPGKKIKVR